MSKSYSYLCLFFLSFAHKLSSYSNVTQDQQTISAGCSSSLPLPLKHPVLVRMLNHGFPAWIRKKWSNKGMGVFIRTPPQQSDLGLQSQSYDSSLASLKDTWFVLLQYHCDWEIHQDFPDDNLRSMLRVWDKPTSGMTFREWMSFPLQV